MNYSICNFRSFQRVSRMFRVSRWSLFYRNSLDKSALRMPQMYRECREKLKRILYRLVLINLVDSWLASIKFVVMPEDREHRAKLRSRNDYHFSHYLFQTYGRWNKYRKRREYRRSSVVNKVFVRKNDDGRSEWKGNGNALSSLVSKFIYHIRIVCLICSRCNSIYRVACYNNCTLAFISSVN